MSEPHDPDADYQAWIRAEHDRQRRNLVGSVSLGTGLPGSMLAFGFAFSGEVQGLWFWLTIAGGVLSLGLLAIAIRYLGRNEPSDEARRLAKATPWFKKLQQGRTHWMMYVFILIFGLMPMCMGAAWDVVSGEGNPARAINAAVGLALISMPVLMLTGRDGSITPKLRKYLDDEHTRAIRMRAMTLGFVVLMVGASGVYLAGLWFRESAVVLTLPVMAIAAFVAVVRFALLERAAERGDDEGG